MPYKDPEKRKTHYREYHEANREKILERMRQYREAHREELREQAREYRNTPRGRANQLVNHFRFQDKKRGVGKCTLTPEWIEENIFTSKCYYCGEIDWHKLGCDRIDNSLPHTPENVVCSCWDCNNKRGTIPFKEFVQRLKDGEPLLKKNRPDKSKPVVAINDAGEIVYEFASTAEAERNGFNSSNVSAACRGCFNRKGNHKYKELNWFYINGSL